MVYNNVVSNMHDRTNEKTRGGSSTPSWTSAGLATTVLDTAFALHLPTTHCVRAGLGRPQSRGGVNGRHLGRWLMQADAQRSACRWAATSGEGARCRRRCIPPHRMSEDAQWPVYQSTSSDWGRLRLWGSKPHR